MPTHPSVHLDLAERRDYEIESMRKKTIQLEVNNNVTWSPDSAMVLFFITYITSASTTVDSLDSLISRKRNLVINDIQIS